MLHPEPPLALQRVKGDKLRALLFGLLDQHPAIRLDLRPFGELLPRLLVHAFDVEEGHLGGFVEPFPHRRLLPLVAVHYHLAVVELHDGLKVEPPHIRLAEELYASVAFAPDDEILHPAAVSRLCALLCGQFGDARLCIVVPMGKLGHQGFDVGAVLERNGGLAGPPTGYRRVGLLIPVDSISVDGDSIWFPRGFRRSMLLGMAILCSDIMITSTGIVKNGSRWCFRNITIVSS